MRKSFKKFLSVTLALVLLLTAASAVNLSASAANEPTVTVETKTIKDTDNTVTLGVAISNNPGIIAFSCQVEYNQNYFTLKTVTEEDAAYDRKTGFKNNDSAMDEEYFTYPYTISVSSDTSKTNIMYNGTLLYLTFEVAENTPAGTYDFNVTPQGKGFIYDVNMVDVTFTGVKGQVTVTCEHNKGEWETETAAKCEEDGKKVKKCKVCGDVLDTDKIPANGHDLNEWSVTTPATCTTAGARVKTCKTCEKVIEKETIPAIGHKVDEWTVTTEPTTEADGEKTGVCSICGDNVKTAIGKLVKSVESTTGVSAKVEAVGETVINSNVELVAKVVGQELSDTEKAKINQAIGELAGDQHIEALVVDIKLVLKQTIVGTGTRVDTESEFDLNGGKVSVTIAISEDLLKNYKDLKLIHMKGDGTYEVVPFVLNADNTVTFETDGFSNYVFTGTPAVQNTTPSGGGQSGDNSAVFAYLMLLMSSAVAVVILFSKKKNSVR